MEKFSVYLKGVLAGLVIAIGGTVYLSVDNKYIGSALFAIGLFLIFSYGFNLYTGKIGYLIENGVKFIPDLCLIWLGNFTGTAAVGLILQLSRITPAISEKAAKLCEIKLNDDLLSIFILGIFCGFLMFVAADNFKNATNAVQKYLAVFLPVMVFILSGFEHCVANMYYFAVSNNWTLKMLLYLIVMTLGNTAGSFIVPLAKKAFR